jgi:hypothetical protein
LLEFCANGFHDAEVVTATRAAERVALAALTPLPLNAEARRGARQETCGAGLGIGGWEGSGQDHLFGGASSRWEIAIFRCG